MRHRALLLVLSLMLFGSACAGNRAYLDWRPGLSEIDFEGLFELSLAEYDAFATEAEANTTFDRYDEVGEVGNTELAQIIPMLAGMLEAAPESDPRGYAIVGVGGDGSVELSGDRGGKVSGPIDWVAITPDRRHAALITGTKLAVVLDGASTGIDIGSLVGGTLGGYQVMMIVRDAELTVFVLPELGGVVTANEPGYLFAFRHQAGGKQPWAISVARVIVKP